DISPRAEARKLVVYRNLGNVVFERVASAVFDPGAARFADFDQDGRLDVCVAASPTNLVVYHNNGAGFDAGRSVELIAQSAPKFDWVAGLEIIDLDGDGIAELSITTQYSGRRSQQVYRRQGDSFESIPAPWAANPIAGIADLDQDQMPDLVLSSPGGPSLAA